MMRYGAVAVIDALGFKGIWAREECKADPGIVLRKMKDLLAAGEKTRDKYKAGLTEYLKDTLVTVHCTLLSDTIFVGVTLERGSGEDLHDKVFAVLVASMAAADMAHLGPLTPPALAYRGCVTCGDFEMDPPFVMGPAVDEAAELHERADAAAIWLTPAAKAVIDGHEDRKAISAVFAIDAAVPLHGGKSYETYVVKAPTLVTSNPEERASWRSALLKSFNSRALDVQIKRQNTEKLMLEMEASILKSGARRA